MKVQRLRLLVLWSLAVLLSTTMAFAANDPSAPLSLDNTFNTTYNPANYIPKSVEAYAGNISALVIHAIGQTKSWQGYYGNVTATITLDDVNNFTFYNWTEANPKGQIYATLKNNIVWSSVNCFDFVSPDLNETNIEAYYNIRADDADGVPETFNTTWPQIQVGDRNLTNCPSTYIFQDDAYQTTNFVNLLLWEQADNTTGWIYSTILENKTVDSFGNNPTCYNGELCDFQLIVNEDGHHTDTTSTVYYFWVELQ